jgi:hypothetical protein
MMNRSTRTSTTIMAASFLIGVPTLLLLAALMPTAVIAFAALDGVTEADDAVQRASEMTIWKLHHLSS